MMRVKNKLGNLAFGAGRGAPTPRAASVKKRYIILAP